MSESDNDTQDLAQEYEDRYFSAINERDEERQRRELCENERDEARDQIKELIYIAERAIDLAEIDFENDKFGVVSELRSGLEEIKKDKK